ncbi:hypothetical protein [Reichenbachiella sp.]|uniref:hypothetical protein n=1 Tax=Reichenbachiella sp. TaxID=2184521 RepID=UPI003B5A0456
MDTRDAWALHAMINPKELINDIRRKNGEIQISALNHYKFNSNANGEDENLIQRTELVETLLEDFSSTDLRLIRSLFDEELKCNKVIGRHDNLYQLCFYLYELGNLEDVYRIFKAKYQSNDMDTSTILDREMLYLNHPVQDVINFVEEDIKLNENIESSRLLETLKELKKRPDYGSVEEYSMFLRGYFFGHETESNGITKGSKKAWWQFWK